MTVIRNNSISGINSITAQSSALNFYDSTGNTLAISADVTGGVTVATGATISGSTNTITASTNGSERVRIDSNGDIGIAKSSPASWGSNIPTIEIKGTASTGGNSTRSGAIAFESGSGSNGYAVLWGQSGGIEIYTGATDRASATYRAKFNSTGNLAFASGQGIDFSAASGSAAGSTSALLDDYEEGTFTPIDSSGAGLTLTEARGHYVKVGNVVHCQVRVVWPSQANSNTAVIGGFPFNANNPSGADVSNGAVPSGFGYISSGSVIPQIHKTGGDDTTYFYNFGAAMTNANFSGIQVRFGVTYRTS